EEGCINYGPVPATVSRHQLNTHLQRLRAGIREGGEVNDVVLIYFRGWDAVAAGKHYLLTEDSKDPGDLPRSGIDCDRLRSFLSDVKGAKLVWLDVRRRFAADGDTVRVGSEAYPHVGFAQYVWLRPPDRVPEGGTLLGALHEAMEQAGRLKVVLQRI